MNMNMTQGHIIENGERAAIMAALDQDTTYDYVAAFSGIPLVRLVKAHL